MEILIVMSEINDSGNSRECVEAKFFLLSPDLKLIIPLLENIFP